MKIPLRVLIVEDSEDDALLLVRELARSDYAPTMTRVDDPDTLADALATGVWDVIITDHNLPGFDSLGALELVKQSGVDVPVIVVSGSIGEDIAVETMKAGAHDYIMKSNLMRLVPAVTRELREAETRRAHRQAEETIRHMAYHDSLTGLVNRNQFESRLSHALVGAKRHGQNHALLYIDLDQFKIINDTCGHVAGDELLRQLAVLLQEPIRECDTLARLGGDEFGVLLDNCPLDRAELIGERLLTTISDFKFSWDDKTFTVGASIGVIAVTAKSKSKSDILRQADMACYAAKDSGRNRIHVGSEDDSELARRHGEMQWVTRINEALEAGRFVIHCQPIVPISATDEVYHYELLVRLLDADGSLILPGAFISAAERFNLMASLDRWVIAKALPVITRSRRSWAEGARSVVFINLSGMTLNDTSFVHFVEDQIELHGVDPQGLGFEITETAAVSNLHQAVPLIRRIRRLGCRFALDDFGSGLSSFSYLRALPVDFLKIDGSFVRNMVSDPMDGAIVEAIQGVAAVAGLRTVAEFVESEEIRQKLVDIGVDYGQGYALSKPMPVELLAGRMDLAHARSGS